MYALKGWLLKLSGGIDATADYLVLGRALEL
jgi:hypothetical protein